MIARAASARLSLQEGGNRAEVNVCSMVNNSARPARSGEIARERETDRSRRRGARAFASMVWVILWWSSAHGASIRVREASDKGVVVSGG
jgi:hypothetical protein